MAKINFLDPLLDWTNGHCGCIDLIEYIPFVNPKPSPLPAPPLPFAVETKERREGKLGYVFVVPLQKPVGIPLLFPFSPSP